MIGNEIYCYVNGLLKLLVTSQETRNILERLAFLIGETKEKVSLQE